METGDEQRYYARRHDFVHYLAGDGIEIGALYNPLDTTGAAITRLRYVDRYDEQGLRTQYPELINRSIVPVDIIDDGQVLGSIPDASIDFVIANNMIEHCDDPLGTIEHWLAKLRVGGIIFLTLPDKRVGWDEQRPLTPLDHLVEDYHADPITRKARNAAHFAEWVTHMSPLMTTTAAESERATPTLSPEERDAQIAHLIAIDYSIHFHVFTYQSFREMLDYARTVMGFPLEIADSARPIPESWESIFILRKTDRALPLPEHAVHESAPLPDEPATIDALQEALAAAETAYEEVNVLAAKYRIEGVERVYQERTLHAKTLDRLRETETRLYHTEGSLLAAQQQLIALQGALDQRPAAPQPSLTPPEAPDAATRELAQLRERLGHIEGTIIPAKNAHILWLEAQLQAMQESFLVRAAWFLHHRLAQGYARIRHRQ